MSEILNIEITAKQLGDKGENLCRELESFLFHKNIKASIEIKHSENDYNYSKPNSYYDRKISKGESQIR